MLAKIGDRTFDITAAYQRVNDATPPMSVSFLVPGVDSYATEWQHSYGLDGSGSIVFIASSVPGEDADAIGVGTYGIHSVAGLTNAGSWMEH
ncbi:MAG TPA: hypothetical protein DHW63_02280 [Hyphomonadaceae bacterium]|nr:hypothetical protein [Hyphomonadaceae bacterium]